MAAGRRRVAVHAEDCGELAGHGARLFALVIEEAAGVATANPNVHVGEVETAGAEEAREVLGVVAKKAGRIGALGPDLDADLVAIGADVDGHLAEFERFEVDAGFAAAGLDAFDDGAGDLVDLLGQFGGRSGGGGHVDHFGGGCFGRASLAQFADG